MTFLERIVAQKHREIEKSARNTPESLLREQAREAGPRRLFAENLQRSISDGPRIIAELKRASPSRGPIRPDIDPVAYARSCERGGAAAMSVLTDSCFFQGSLEDARMVRNAVELPVLRKDFILSDYQIWETRAAGLDAVLLIVRILEPTSLRDLLDLCRELELDALVEVHSETDLEKAAAAGARLIGINSRDLSSFQTDPDVCRRLVPLLGPDQIPVAASGIHRREDIRRLTDWGVGAFLIGESIMQSPDPELFLRELREVSERKDG